MKCTGCGENMTPITAKETTTKNLVRLVKRCPECGWFIDAKRVPPAEPDDKR